MPVTQIDIAKGTQRWQQADEPFGSGAITPLCRYVRCTSTYTLASGSSGSGVCTVLKQKIPRRQVLKDQHLALQEHLVSASDDLAHVSLDAPLPVADDARCLWKAQFVGQVGEPCVWRCHKGY